jgi:predicted N-acetyltransferase YhbS
MDGNEPITCLRWRVRLAGQDIAGACDLDVLAAVEMDAFASLAAAFGVHSQAGTVTPRHMLEQSCAAKLLFVACDDTAAVIGFVAAMASDGWLSIDEIDVVVGWQRRGIGRALMLRALDEVAVRGLRGATLTTDRHVPFNAPFYASLGFREVSCAEAPARLTAALAAEIARGGDPVRRVMMVRGF